jgi:peptide/nickel transport system substrate-binding protein
MRKRGTIYSWASIAFKAFILFCCFGGHPSMAAAEPRHGIAMHGQMRHPPGFTHFSYVNPEAPKGGRVVFAVLGSFDSLNPLIIRGVPAAGLRGHVYESLMARAYDEPFSLYGLLAETIETPPDRSWVTFTLRKEAKFSDGHRVTVDDLVFSHALLRDKGRKNHRDYYSKVTKVEKVGERSVKFTFAPGGDREMPLILGLMPVLPKHKISRETFETTSLEAPVGSGPYIVSAVDAPKSITYTRNPDYWGRALAVNRGRFNFDEIRYEYYRDGAAMFEAFKKGLYHLRPESDPGRWAQGYDFPAIKDGRVVKDEFPVAVPSGMSALVFNTRRPLFADSRVRKALTLLFDFEWLNKSLYHGLYTRTQSYFDRSELSSHGRPADDYEKRLLAPFAKEVEPAILDGTYALPVSDGSGQNRANRRKALVLLKRAGYVLKEGKLVNAKTGEPFSFEIMAATSGQERLLLSYTRTLKKAGISARIRLVDSAQYQRRRQDYDFDMIQNFWYASLSPGNEQNFRWNSRLAGEPGSFNYPGVKNPAVDTMISALLAAENRPNFVSAVRALDRVLLSGHYVIPLFHLPRQWVARWGMLRYPDTTSLYGYRVDSWWIDPSGEKRQGQ